MLIIGFCLTYVIVGVHRYLCRVTLYIKVTEIVRILTNPDKLQCTYWGMLGVLEG